jgi:hypothetical protein
MDVTWAVVVVFDNGVVRQGKEIGGGKAARIDFKDLRGACADDYRADAKMVM